jgi:hypothetical protein
VEALALLILFDLKDTIKGQNIEPVDEYLTWTLDIDFEPFRGHPDASSYSGGASLGQKSGGDEKRTTQRYLRCAGRPISLPQSWRVLPDGKWCGQRCACG